MGRRRHRTFDDSCDDPFDARMEFADPGGRSSLRAAGKGNRRNLPTTKFHYEQFDDCYRVWLSSNPGDVFDCIPVTESEGLLKFFKANPSMFIEGMPEDEA